MDIAVTLPMRAYSREELEGFAQAAEEGPFASVTVGERIAYNNHDALTALSIMAGMTKRVKLHTGVLLLPLHEPVTLAKRCASLELLSNGRLWLGMGVGSREFDFDSTQKNWKERGKKFEEHLAMMRKVWRGDSPYEGSEPVAPFMDEGHPKVLVGGFVEAALRRAGRLTDGVRSFDFAPDVKLHDERYAIVKEAWDEAGKPGRPWITASTFFALGDDARQIYEKGMKEFYGYTAEMEQWALTDTAPTSVQAVRDVVKRFEDAGYDEVGFATAHHLGPDSWRRLADAVG